MNIGKLAVVSCCESDMCFFGGIDCAVIVGTEALSA